MYRYYSTKRPIGPGTFPLFATKMVCFEESVEVPGIGPAWGFLEYEQGLSNGVAERYGLVPARMQTFTVRVTSIHTLEVEAESEDEAVEEACGKAWEYDADEISGKIVCDSSGGMAIALDLGLADKLKEVMSSSDELKYRMLSQMKSDCEYFLGYGNRCDKYLRGKKVDEHIAYMKALWLSFPTDKKPEWLGFEEIAVYEKRMSEEDQHDN